MLTGQGKPPTGVRDRARDPAQTLRRIVTAAVVVLLLLSAAAATWSVRRSTSQLGARELETAERLARIADRLPAGGRASALVDPAGDDGVALLTEDGRMVPADLGAGQDGPLWRRWTGLVARTSRVATQFRTRDPDGTVWRHVSVPTADGGRVLLSQRGPDGTAVQTSVLRGFALVGAATLLLGSLLWLAVRRGFLAPLDRLIEASEDLRWRGRVPGPPRTGLDETARRTDPVGRLAASLMAVEDHITRNFLELSTLLETNRIVAGSLDVQQVFDNILHQIQRLFGVDRCAVLSLDGRANVFVIRASRGLSERFVRELRISPTAPDSPAMRALRSGSPVQISDTTRDHSYAEFRDRSDREGFGSVLAIPLSTSVAPPAVLLVYKSVPHRYSHSELELAASFVGFASLAMENAALYSQIDEQLRAQTSRLEAIVESLDDGLVLTDPDGVITYHNPAAAALAGLDTRSLVGVPVAALLGPIPGVAPPGEELPATAPVVRAEKGKGRPRDLRIRSFVVTDPNGGRLGRGQLWQDISEERAVERMKSALLATVSHELRAPLANIKGYATTLLADDVAWTVGDQREFLTTISSETDRLVELVRNVLDVSRIEAGMVTLTLERVPPAELLDRVAASFAPSQRTRIRVVADPSLPAVELDRARIEICVRNLIDNALKFSPVGTPIDVQVHLADDGVVFGVRDRGPGVAPELRDRVFDSFVRGDDSLTREVGGFGLGLAICRGFVEVHDGRIWMEDADSGTLIRFSVPCAPRVGTGAAP
jgi:signal transduction histidine kinase